MKTQEQNLSLFQITQDRVTLEEIMDELGGDLSPEMEKALELNKEQLERKGESYIVILEQLHAYVEFNKRYAEQAERNIRRATNSIGRLKANLLAAAKVFGAFDAGIHHVGTRKSHAVHIENENLIPETYKNRLVTMAPDKKKIADAIRTGATVEGASLKTTFTLKIS
jgi:hypothetical protein